MDLLREVEHLLGGVVAVGEEGRLGEGGHPVLVPEEVEEVGVQGGLEVRDLEGVVSVVRIGGQGAGNASEWFRVRKKLTGCYGHRNLRFYSVG